MGNSTMHFLVLTKSLDIRTGKGAFMMAEEKKCVLTWISNFA